MSENHPGPLAETLVPEVQPKVPAGPQVVFGIVALQNGFISRAQLVAAFAAWLQDKSRGITDLLVAHGALAESDREILGHLVSQLLEKHAGDAEAALAGLSTVAEVLPQLEQLGDADLTTSLRKKSCDAAGVMGATAYHHGAPQPRMMPNGKFRARLVPVLTETSSWMSDRCASAVLRTAPADN